jgi:hypothetical protein
MMACDCETKPIELPALGGFEGSGGYLSARL